MANTAYFNNLSKTGMGVNWVSLLWYYLNLSFSADGLWYNLTWFAQLKKERSRLGASSKGGKNINNKQANNNNNKRERKKEKKREKGENERKKASESAFIALEFG